VSTSLKNKVFDIINTDSVDEYKKLLLSLSDTERENHELYASHIVEKLKSVPTDIFNYANSLDNDFGLVCDTHLLKAIIDLQNIDEIEKFLKIFDIRNRDISKYLISDSHLYSLLLHEKNFAEKCVSVLVTYRAYDNLSSVYDFLMIRDSIPLFESIARLVKDVENEADIKETFSSSVETSFLNRSISVNMFRHLIEKKYIDEHLISEVASMIDPEMWGKRLVYSNLSEYIDVVYEVNGVNALYEIIDDLKHKILNEYHYTEERNIMIQIRDLIVNIIKDNEQQYSFSL